MNFESYKQVFIRKKDDDICLREGRSYSIDFEIDDVRGADRLFFTGESGIFHEWKTESDYQYIYRRIDDSLSHSEADRSQYALDMSADNFNYPKIAYKKILWWPRFYGGGARWKIGISAKAEKLRIHEGGYLHFLLEIRYKKDGIDKAITYTEPDETVKIDIPEGDYAWERFYSDAVTLKATVASMCVYLEGEKYSGKVFFEAPFLASENDTNLLPGFAPFIEDKPHFNWFGVNLSKKETPSLKIEINGVTVHDGEIFERCHRYSEWEVKIPEGVLVEGKNSVTFTHTSSFRDAPPYMLHEVGIVSVRRDMLISCPEWVTVGKPFPLLVKTQRDGAVFELKNAPEYITAVGELKCGDSGLNVIYLLCEKAANGISFTVSCDGVDAECVIDRAVIKNDDNVYVGTGDEVYINQNKESFEDFISWYVSNGVGNFITVRPTYRWSGSKAADGELWREFAGLMNKLGIKYAHMLDGRELQGCNSNPKREELEGEHFLGRQTHELDGSLVYWGYREFTKNVNEQMFYDLFMRMFKKDGERMNIRFTPVTYMTTGGKIALYRDCTLKKDMEVAANYFVQKLADHRYGSERHTGPTSLFKYFYQAGYKFTGAELMYSATEVTCAALRGAARLYGGNTGAHHAVQWSSTPHDRIDHYKRYRLALYITYMQGINEINTEEGLWRMEEYFAYHHRFSEGCLGHTKEHRNFYRYLATHTRSGRFFTPIAFLHGRYDGWCLFAGRGTVWGLADCPYCDAEESWDLLDTFYPKNVQQALYRHPAPKNKPVGYYSGTPQGNVDIIPIEGDNFASYPLLMAIGYNKALEEDMNKLYSYVSGGGTLFIGLAQLSTTTLREDIVNYRMDYISHPFRELIAPNIDFCEDAFIGERVHVCRTLPEGATVEKATDSGRALIYSMNVGDGRVYVLNTLEYAGNSALRALVSETMSSLAEACTSKEPVWAEGDDAVQFALYKQDNGDSHVYFISADWYDEEESEHIARLRVGEIYYEIPISFGRMIKAVVSGDVAAWFDCEENDVLEIADGCVKVQGCVASKLYVARNGIIDTFDVDLSQNSIGEVKI